MRDEIAQLRKSASRLLYSEDMAGHASTRVLGMLKSLGPVALFGGMLRDLVLGSSVPPSTDIDLVVATQSRELLRSHLEALGAEQNRYGGHRVAIDRWTFDIWALDQTWAFREGLVKDPSFANLVRTTFFNWDAIVLELESEALHFLPDYFQEIHSRFLELNLEPNANPVGNVLRAVRQMSQRGARWGARLSRYVLDFVADPGRLHELRSRSLAEYLSGTELSSFINALRRHVRAHEKAPFSFDRLPSRAFR